jgi:4-amino-4-deoxy-L-arabinose transferase-like glycosyltransferase
MRNCINAACFMLGLSTMRPHVRPALIGLGWVLIIGLLGATIMGGAMIRLAFFVVVAVVAAILALIARQKPRRITRIAVLLGALTGAGINYPQAAAEAHWRMEQKKSNRVTSNSQPTPPANSESAK